MTNGWEGSDYRSGVEENFFFRLSKDSVAKGDQDRNLGLPCSTLVRGRMMVLKSLIVCEF